MGFYGSIEEHGHPTILGLRLKIKDRKISEIEAIALRSTARGTFSAVGDLKVAPIMAQALAPSEKRSRDELITVANSYFEGMEKGTDKETPFDKDCKRIENGVVTANDPGNAKGDQPDVLRSAIRHWLHQGDYQGAGAAPERQEVNSPPRAESYFFFAAAASRMAFMCGRS